MRRPRSSYFRYYRCRRGHVEIFGTYFGVIGGATEMVFHPAAWCRAFSIARCLSYAGFRDYVYYFAVLTRMPISMIYAISGPPAMISVYYAVAASPDTGIVLPFSRQYHLRWSSVYFLLRIGDVFRR